MHEADEARTIEHWQGGATPKDVKLPRTEIEGGNLSNSRMIALVQLRLDMPTVNIGRPSDYDPPLSKEQNLTKPNSARCSGIPQYLSLDCNAYRCNACNVPGVQSSDAGP